MRAFTFIALTAMLCLLSPAAQASGKKSTVRVNKTERLAPNATVEYCAELNVGQVVRYRFEAGTPLQFKLHAPEVADPTQGAQEGTLQSLEYVDFKPPQAARWCWSWTNRGTAATQINYSMFIAPSRRVQRK